MSTSVSTLRLGTRGSLLALKQSGLVAEELQRRLPQLRIETVIITTSGDRILDRPLHEFGGKGLFTKEIEQTLIDGAVDFAVHSFKDVPVTTPLVDVSALCFAAVPPREDPRDLLVSMSAKTIAQLPLGARVGTSSLRRQCQLLALRADLSIESIRGNVDTRVRKLREGQFDAVILAAAGMRRSGLFDASFMHPIGLDEMLPAAGQGALALQCRAGDSNTRQLLSALNDESSQRCVTLERSLVQALGGDCQSPIAALAVVDKDRIFLRACVGTAGGGLPVIRAAAESPIARPDEALSAVLRSLSDQNVHKVLGRST